MTDPVRREYEIDIPLGAARAKSLLAFIDVAITHKRAMNVGDAINLIAAGTLVTPTLTAGEAAELKMFLDEAIAQKVTLGYRASLARLAIGGSLVIKLQTPP